MNRSEIFTGVQDVFQDIFDDDFLKITSETCSDDIDDWDSLNHINLVCAIEKEFNIRFTLAELSELKDVGEMIDLIFAKIS